MVRVAAPISDTVERRVRQAATRLKEEAARAKREPVLILELMPGANDFGQALDVARFLTSDALSGVRLVAYAPESLTGHALLVALACDEIMLGPAAEIGDAGRGEANIGPEMRSVYAEVAARRQTVPVDLALGMLDPALEVLQVETEASREFVLAERFGAIREQHAIQSSQTLIRAGEPGLFSAEEARGLGFVSFLADDRAAVARALGLAREAVEEDPSLGGQWQAVRIELRGEIKDNTARRWQHALNDQLRRTKANLIVVTIDSAGGSPVEALNLANFLADLDPAERRTVAYIAHEARGEAAYVAWACDQIVMHPDAVLGGEGTFEASAADIDTASIALGELSRAKSRPAAVGVALVDAERPAFRYTRADDGATEYFSPEEVAKLERPDDWKQGPRLGQPGERLQLDGNLALDAGVARSVVADFAEFKQLYDLTNDPALAEPGWVDVLVDVLNSWAGRGLLVTIGLMALWVEMKTPGVGIAGLTALVCFALFFWSSFLGGTADWLEVMMFVTGVFCIVVEIFLLPGFGVFGLGGGLLVLGSLVLASQTFVLPRDGYQWRQMRDSMLGVGLGIVGAGFGAVLLRKLLFASPLIRGAVLQPPRGAEREEIAAREALGRFEHLIGHRGRVVTRLSPAGKIRIGDQIVDVVSEGEIIDVGVEVEITSARGNHVVVHLAP